MKKFTTIALAGLMSVSTFSCSESDPVDDTVSAKEEALSHAVTAYVDHTVRPTYKGMADAAVNLYDRCIDIQTRHSEGTLTEADIKEAAEAWKESRRYWELSEAFLFGPAADYNIT